LLDNDNKFAVYTDIIAELPVVESEQYKWEYQTMMDEPEPEFRELVAVTLDDSGIYLDDRLQAACEIAMAATQQGGACEPALVEANDDKIVYKLTFNLPDAGLFPVNVGLGILIGDDQDNNIASPAAPSNNDDKLG
jgi:hypothetical protein